MQLNTEPDAQVLALRGMRGQFACQAGMARIEPHYCEAELLVSLATWLE